MTRINLIKPSELSDQHLIAEYREIFMVGSALQRSLKSKKWNTTKLNLPNEFTLNIGHVKFFYNKGKYLHKRYLKIIKDLLEKNKNLQDEVDSLWMMLDEMTKSDIENWSSILEELNASVAERMLMVTKKKADA